MSIRTIAGDCLVHVHGRRERTVRNRVLVVVGPPKLANYYTGCQK